MDKGISNIEIEKFFHNEQNEDLRKNYMGVYSMDSVKNILTFMKQ